jgi:pantoate--beta-alanine ligase
MQKILEQGPDVQVEYLAICNANNLEPLTQVKGKVVLLGAMRLGNVRLIDNRLVRCP